MMLQVNQWNMLRGKMTSSDRNLDNPYYNNFFLKYDIQDCLMCLTNYIEPAKATLENINARRN